MAFSILIVIGNAGSAMGEEGIAYPRGFSLSPVNFSKHTATFRRCLAGKISHSRDSEGAVDNWTKRGEFADRILQQ